MREAHLARARLRTAADDRAGRRRVMRRAERPACRSRGHRSRARSPMRSTPHRALRRRRAAAAVPAAVARACSCRCPAGRPAGGCARRRRRRAARASARPVRARRRDRARRVRGQRPAGCALAGIIAAARRPRAAHSAHTPNKVCRAARAAAARRGAPRRDSPPAPPRCVPSRARVRGRQQHAFDRLELAGQAQLAVELASRASDASATSSCDGRQQDAERDRQVVAAAFLGQIRGREIDRDAAGGEFEAGVLRARRARGPCSPSPRWRADPTMENVGSPLPR